MTIKIKDELEQEIEKMAKDGYNCRVTALKVGLNPETVRQWAIRKGIKFQTGKLEIRQKEPKFLELLRSGCLITHACQKLRIDFRLGKEWAMKNGLESSIRSRAKAALDKVIPLEEANKRVPGGHGTVIGWEESTSSYVIKRYNGTTYNRIASQIFRGDPTLSTKKRDNKQEVANKLLEMGYRLIPDSYTKKHESLQAEHIGCGYIRQTIFGMIIKQDCPRCSNTGTSKEERALNDWVRSLSGIDSKKFRFKKDCIGKGKGKEIDIYIPELKLGIEYCGLYHHGEVRTLDSLKNKIRKYSKREKKYEKTNFDSPKWRHRAKMDKANGLGIRLITIFSHEWKKHQKKVKAVLKAKLGKNEIKIFARKTMIKEIDKKEAMVFLETYHLQGSAPTMARFGLFHQGELVAVITGNHHHRIKGKFVLNRLCFKSDTTVVGGASKLNSALESWAVSNKYNEIISWSDNRWSEGEVYRALGYTLDSELHPDYFYFDNKGNTYSKQSCQKKNLLKKGASGETEWQMAQSLGLDRIWDCGKKTWVKKL